MRVSEADWALLNAYADGELPPEEAEPLAARLAADPGLAAELERLRGLKRGLSALRPGRSRGRRHAVPSVALAASVAGLLLLGWAMQDRDPPLPEAATVAALHGAFSAEHYDVADVALPGEGHGVAFAGVRAPDISSSNLTLVAHRRVGAEGREGLAWHYRGQRGCRITLVAGALAAEASAFVLARRWTVRGTPVALVAEGMDGDRFAAIAEFAESRTRETGDADALRVAVVERTAAATPCA